MPVKTNKFVMSESKICLLVYSYSTLGLAIYPKVIWVIMENSSKGIFKQRSSTGSKAHVNEFVFLLSVCTLIDTICLKM